MAHPTIIGAEARTLDAEPPMLPVHIKTASRFRLQKGEKYNVDRLGTNFVRVAPEILNGTDIWEHAVETAQFTFFKAGMGPAVRLGNEDCEVRLYPGRDRMVFAWGYRHVTGEVLVAANVYAFDQAIREQLEAKGLLPRAH
jgi:hypothetical protein